MNLCTKNLCNTCLCERYHFLGTDHCKICDHVQIYSHHSLPAFNLIEFTLTDEVTKTLFMYDLCFFSVFIRDVKYNSEKYLNDHCNINIPTPDM